MKTKLLIVDDSTTIQKIVAMAFENENTVVQGCGNGKEALGKIPQFKPDIVVLDIDMPGINGFEVSKKIKAMAPFSTVPVLLLKSDFEEFNEDLFKSSKADDFISKPFKSDNIVKKVKELLAKAPPRQPDESPAMEQPAPVEETPAQGEVVALSLDNAMETESAPILLQDQETDGVVELSPDVLVESPESAGGGERDISFDGMLADIIQMENIAQGETTSVDEGDETPPESNDDFGLGDMIGDMMKDSGLPVFDLATTTGRTVEHVPPAPEAAQPKPAPAPATKAEPMEEPPAQAERKAEPEAPPAGPALEIVEIAEIEEKSEAPEPSRKSVEEMSIDELLSSAEELFKENVEERVVAKSPPPAAPPPPAVKAHEPKAEPLATVPEKPIAAHESAIVAEKKIIAEKTPVAVPEKMFERPAPPVSRKEEPAPAPEEESLADVDRSAHDPLDELDAVFNAIHSFMQEDIPGDENKSIIQDKQEEPALAADTTHVDVEQESGNLWDDLDSAAFGGVGFDEKPDLIQEALSYLSELSPATREKSFVPKNQIDQGREPAMSTEPTGDIFVKVVGEHIKRILERSLKESIAREISGLSKTIERSVKEIVKEVTPDIARAIIQEEIEKIKKLEEV